jgi:hypothetical protein
MEAKSTNIRYSHEEVFSNLRKRIAEKANNYNV